MQKLTCNNFIPDFVKLNAYAKFDQISSICSQDIERKQNFDNNQEAITAYLPKLTRNYPNLDPANIHAYIKFGVIASICSQDIKRKRSRNDGMTESWTIWKQYTSHTLYAWV